MHIPDNYLSVSTCAVLTIATAPVWVHSVKKVARDFPRERFSALGVAAAFSFLAMMFNVPLPGGTTGHAVGGTVLAVLLGPEATCLALTIALLIQAALFGDGGILALGANCFNMAFLLPFGGYFSFLLLRKFFGILTKKTSKDGLSLSEILAIGVASFVGLNLAALAAAIEFGIQPLLFTDSAGQALYCPYPLAVSLPAMAIGHLTLFGAAEVVFSVVVYAFVRKASPDFAVNSSIFAFDANTNWTSIQEDDAVNNCGKKRAPRFGAVYLLLAILIACVPLGLVAEGTAWGEWGPDEIAEVENNGKALGYTPKGMTDGFQWTAALPDYTAAGLPDWGAYILCAIAGVAISIVGVKLLSAFGDNDAHEPEFQ